MLPAPALEGSAWLYDSIGSPPQLHAVTDTLASGGLLRDTAGAAECVIALTHAKPGQRRMGA